MKIDILEKIQIPEGIEIEIKGNEIKLGKEGKENIKLFSLKNINVEKKENELILSSKKATKRELKIVKTIVAHINNMIKGLEEGFEYKLEVAFVHFPMTVKYDEGKKEIVITNFLGEKKPRICKVLEGTEVEINGNQIIVKSYNKELAGQMAANLEKATIVKGKDTRKFQDGIYITEKPGRII